MIFTPVFEEDEEEEEEEESHGNQAQNTKQCSDQKVQMLIASDILMQSPRITDIVHFRCTNAKPFVDNSINCWVFFSFPHLLKCCFAKTEKLTCLDLRHPCSIPVPGLKLQYVHHSSMALYFSLRRHLLVVLKGRTHIQQQFLHLNSFFFSSEKNFFF